MNSNAKQLFDSLFQKPGGMPNLVMDFHSKAQSENPTLYQKWMLNKSKGQPPMYDGDAALYLETGWQKTLLQLEEQSWSDFKSRNE